MLGRFAGLQAMVLSLTSQSCPFVHCTVDKVKVSDPDDLGNVLEEVWLHYEKLCVMH